MNHKKTTNKKTIKYKEPKKKPTIKNDKKINRWVWLALAVVIITTFAIYFKAIHFEIFYCWDDNVYIRENNFIKALRWENIKSIFSTFYFGNYHPFTTLFYAIEYKTGHGDFSVFHFNNILLHLINTVLVFVFIRKISPSNQAVALITAAFFAVHPMHVESVAWVSERKDVLYTFFFLLSLIFYSDYLKSQKIKHLLLAFFLFVFSCFSKSAAVVLPWILLLLDYYAGRKISRKMFLEKIPFFIISLIFGIVAIYSQKSSGAIQNMAPTMTFMEHLATIAHSFVTYIFKAFVPVGLSAYYPYPSELGTSTLPLIYYLSFFIVALLVFFVWYSRKWGKDIVFGFLFFVITIILVLQIIPIGAASMAERYTYIPYIGLFFIVGKLFETSSGTVKAGKKLKNGLLIVLALGFITFSAITNERVKKWENEEILFSEVIARHPGVGIAYLNRGNYYYSYYANTLFVNDFFKRKTHIEKAARDFESALKCDLSKDNKVKAYFNLGTAKKDLGDYTGAIKDLDSAIKIDNGYYNAYNNRGAAKYMVNDYQGAIDDWNRAIELNPHLTEAISNRDTLTRILKTKK